MLPRDQSGVRRIHDESIGPPSDWPSPFASGRRRPDTFGSSLPAATHHAFNVADHLPSPSSAPRSSLSTGEPRTSSRSTHAPLLGFDSPLQRLKRRAPVWPGDSNLRHVPSSGILTPSTSCFALRLAGLVSSRPTLLGFTRAPPSRTSLVSRFETSGDHALASSPVRRSFERRSSARGSSPRPSPLPWQPGFLTRTSSLALERATPGFPDDTHPVLRSLHHERIGMFSASCEGRDPCLPEVLDAVPRARRLEVSNAASGLPLDRLGSVTAALPISSKRPSHSAHGPSCDGRALRVHSASSDPTTNRVVMKTYKQRACQRRKERGPIELSTGEFVRSHASTDTFTIAPQSIHRSIHRWNVATSDGVSLRERPELRLRA
jgi:hypothetical protein